MTSYPRFDGTQACVGLTPGLAAAFDGAADPAPAVKICPGCVFLSACRGHALDHDVVGVWGGTTDADRRRLRAESGMPAPVSVTAELDALVWSWRTAAEAAVEQDPPVPSLPVAS